MVYYHVLYPGYQIKKIEIKIVAVTGAFLHTGKNNNTGWLMGGAPARLIHDSLIHLLTHRLPLNDVFFFFIYINYNAMKNNINKDE